MIRNKTSLLVGLLVAGFACKADNLFMGEDSVDSGNGNPASSTGGQAGTQALGGSAGGLGGAVADAATTSLPISTGGTATGGATTKPTVGTGGWGHCTPVGNHHHQTLHWHGRSHYDFHYHRIQLWKWHYRSI
jgi:hypothetical protein